MERPRWQAVETEVAHRVEGVGVVSCADILCEWCDTQSNPCEALAALGAVVKLHDGRGMGLRYRTRPSATCITYMRAVDDMGHIDFTMRIAAELGRDLELELGA